MFDVSCGNVTSIYLSNMFETVGHIDKTQTANNIPDSL